MNTCQVSEYLSRTPGAIRNLVLRRAIPYRKPGGRLMFLKREIDAWVDGSPGVTLEDLNREQL